jgi:hypothetical protein
LLADGLIIFSGNELKKPIQKNGPLDPDNRFRATTVPSSLSTAADADLAGVSVYGRFTEFNRTRINRVWLFMQIRSGIHQVIIDLIGTK